MASLRRGFTIEWGRQEAEAEAEADADACQPNSEKINPGEKDIDEIFP